jgi:hypothetical protein
MRHHPHRISSWPFRCQRWCGRRCSQGRTWNLSSYRLGYSKLITCWKASLLSCLFPSTVNSQVFACALFMAPLSTSGSEWRIRGKTKSSPNASRMVTHSWRMEFLSSSSLSTWWTRRETNYLSDQNLPFKSGPRIMLRNTFSLMNTASCQSTRKR